MKIFDLEGQKSIFKVITYLNEHNEATLTKMKEDGNISQGSLYNALKKLLKLRLIEEDYELHFPRRRYFKLTTKGKAIAEKLVEIEKLLGE